MYKFDNDAVINIVVIMLSRPSSDQQEVEIRALISGNINTEMLP